LEQVSTHLGSHRVNVAIGIVGMLLVIAGTLLPADLTQKLYYLLGAGLMLISATLERQRFFIILEIIIVAGTAVALTSLSGITKEAVPLLLSILALSYFAVRGELKDPLTLFGTIGLIVLAIGFAITNPIIYLVGGLLLAIYSYGSFRRGVKIAMIWAVLNAIFVVTSIVAVWRFE